MTAFLSTPGSAGGVSTPSQLGFTAGTNQVDLRAYCARANWGATTGLGAFLALWSSTVANCRYMLSAGTGGTLIAQWYNTAGVLQTCTSTANLAGLAAGSYKWVRAIINPGAGTCDFATSDDNVTWTALGTQITGKTTTAVQTTGTTPALVVGSDSTSTNAMAVKFLHTQLRVNNVLICDIDWTSFPSNPTGPWAAQTTETWTRISSLNVINQEDAATNSMQVSSASAFAYDAGTTTFQIGSYGGTPGPPAPTYDPSVYQDCISAGSPRAVRMINYLPPYYFNDPTVRGYICACAKELDRIEAQADELRDGAYPFQADERTLEYYENLFQLTITGLTTAQRQDQVVAHVRQREVASRLEWQESLLDFIGPTGWSYAESLTSPYTILLTTPVDPTGQRTPVITAYARAITPAHLQLIVNGNFGNFKVGISEIGIDPL